MNSAPINEQRSTKWIVLPQMNSAPPNKHCSPKWIFGESFIENGRFRTQNMRVIGQKKLWSDRCIEKVFRAKKLAQLVIPVRSTFQSDLHTPLGDPHRQLDFI